jgi:hypothetical protein
VLDHLVEEGAFEFDHCRCNNPTSAVVFPERSFRHRGEPAGDRDRPGPALHRDPDVGPADASTGELLRHPLGVERGDQQPARGLRVREHQLLGDRKLPPLHVRAQVRVVALGAARDHIEHREIEDAGEHRHRGRVDPRAHPRGREHPLQVAEQPEPRHVGRGLGADLGHRVGRRIVGGRHQLDGRRQQRGVGDPALVRGRRDPDPEGLGEEQVRLGRHGRVTGDAFGIGEPERDHPVLRLRVGDRVATEEGGARLARDVDAALQDLAEHLERQVVDGPGDDVQREERPRAHRVHVGERVGGRDPAPVVRVVHDRGEEVERRDQRLPVRQPHHRGIVPGVGGDEHVGAELGEGERAEDRLEIRRPELAPAPGPVAEARESPLLHHLSEDTAAGRKDADPLLRVPVSEPPAARARGAGGGGPRSWASTYCGTSTPWSTPTGRGRRCSTGPPRSPSWR